MAFNDVHRGQTLEANGGANWEPWEIRWELPQRGLSFFQESPAGTGIVFAQAHCRGTPAAFPIGRVIY